MSVEQIEASIESMSASERLKFVRWFDEHRHELVDQADDFALSDEQRAELLRRRAEALAHPELLEPWEGTTQKLRTQLNEIRRQKAQAR
jgi:hypothetical protein